MIEKRKAFAVWHGGRQRRKDGMAIVRGIEMEKFAIAFDLDADTLFRVYGEASVNNAYRDIKIVLAAYGFERQQGSVYFGNKNVDAVKTVLAARKLAKIFMVCCVGAGHQNVVH